MDDVQLSASADFLLLTRCALHPLCIKESPIPRHIVVFQARQSRIDKHGLVYGVAGFACRNAWLSQPANWQKIPSTP